MLKYPMFYVGPKGEVGFFRSSWAANTNNHYSRELIMTTDGRTPASPDTYSILVGEDSEITKLTQEVLDRHIMREEFHHFHDKVTLCMIHMKNGFIAKGVGGVVDSTIFDANIGNKVAKENAMNEVWKVMGYQLQTELAKKKLVEANI